MITSRRLPMEPIAPMGERNIRIQYPIQNGTWVAHPNINKEMTSFCAYALPFRLEKESTFTLHISADQRFELFCDGDFIGMGPDRNDQDHWSFHIYEITLPAGEHHLRAEVTFLHQHAPHAQDTIRPAFLLYSENAPVNLNTGSAPWVASLRQGIETIESTNPHYHVIGPTYVMDGARLAKEETPLAVVSLTKACETNNSGIITPGWKLLPSRLPEQTRRPVHGGRVRSVSELAPDTPPAEIFFHETTPQEHAAWQALFDNDTPVTIDAKKRIALLWDCEEYHCAYPEVTFSGGKSARITLEWAESCYAPLSDGAAIHDQPKTNRNDIEGKQWVGFGDVFLPSGETHNTLRSPWWRAGRYVLLVIETADTAVTLESVRFLETRLPLECESIFESDDTALQPVISVMVRGIQMCAHETYMDCPYYEQMMYTGDTRLQMLTAYTISSEDTLNKRGLELFDWSRQYNGFVLGRHPSFPRQAICSFSPIWILMVRDFAWWRNDAAFVRERMVGVRAMLEEFRQLQKTDGLLNVLPGWSFVDWVRAWYAGYAPGALTGESSIINLFLLNALRAAIDLEEGYGSKHFAAEYRDWADALASTIRATFWNEERKLFADDVAHAHWSEHAQCLALLSGAFPDLEAACFTALLQTPDLEQTTIYFSFYLLETYARFGRGDLVTKKLDFWKEMVARGLKTPVEAPEPNRSDCHGWGSHPLFHMHATLAGVRPDAPGFARVRIAPSPGSLKEFVSVLPHPAGVVHVSMTQKDGVWRVHIVLPENIPGVLVWQGTEHTLSKENDFTLPVD